MQDPKTCPKLAPPCHVFKIECSWAVFAKKCKKRDLQNQIFWWFNTKIMILNQCNHLIRQKRVDLMQKRDQTWQIYGVLCKKRALAWSSKHVFGCKNLIFDEGKMITSPKHDECNWFHSNPWRKSKVMSKIRGFWSKNIFSSHNRTFLCSLHILKCVSL